MTTFATTLVVAVLATAWAVASPLATPCASAESLGSISAAPSESAAFVNSINQLRASKGLNQLIVNGNLTDVAQDWAVHMAEEDAISHRLDLRAGITALWKAIGENVGVGPTVSELMSAFIASPGHYKNLVDPRFTHIGVGTVRTSGGLLYTSHEFMALDGAAPPPAVVTTPTAPPAPRAPRVTAPKVTTPVTAPPTTVAPVPETTTTTMLVLPTEQYKLQDSGEDDYQEQKSQSNGRCRSHTSPRLMAMSAGSVTR
ncbi:MAG: hypothetical protein QOF21_527 [Actinomycetota bacterium]|jgi:uncharacterized protein YkwD